jgi:hypothetical protein
MDVIEVLHPGVEIPIGLKILLDNQFLLLIHWGVFLKI